MTRPILDMTAGSRMFWWDKENPLETFVDNRLSGGTTMHKYQLEVTKNGATKSTIIRSDEDREALWDKIWKWFGSGSRWAYGNVMVNDPDIIQLFEIENDVETAVAANKTAA
jgi:hypothetical protein